MLCVKYIYIYIETNLCGVWPRQHQLEKKDIGAKIEEEEEEEQLHMISL